MTPLRRAPPPPETHALSAADGSCGSAGTYSILQAELSQELLSNKLTALQKNTPELIVTANVGCQLHMQSKASVPVKHWIELLDESFD